MNLGKIGPGDIENTVKCIRRAVQISNARDYPASVIKTQLKQHYTLNWMKKTVRSRYCIIAKEGNDVRGTGAIICNELRNIFVDPDHQQQGIGRQIVRHLEREARKRQYGEVWLVSSITAREFYRKMGYIDLEEVQERIGDDIVTGYRMMKTITEGEGILSLEAERTSV